MKIVSWNCQGAFRNKAAEIAAYRPDIAVIQECEYEDRLNVEPNFPRPHTPIQCFGELAYKGLCVMSYTGLEFELDESYDADIQYCIPLRVKGKNLNLIAVWTQDHTDKKISYVGQAYRAILHYESFIKSADTILIGDFNSNQQWDKMRSVGNHSDVVNGLKEMGIVSLYHELNNEKHGKESVPTWYKSRKLEVTYHIDYCFIPESLINRVTSFRIGDYNDWKHLSDHSPMFVEFEMDKENFKL